MVGNAFRQLPHTPLCLQDLSHPADGHYGRLAYEVRMAQLESDLAHRAYIRRIPCDVGWLTINSIRVSPPPGGGGVSAKIRGYKRFFRNFRGYKGFNDFSKGNWSQITLNLVHGITYKTPILVKY